MTTRVLVTGAQGFVGRYAIAHLLSSWTDIEVLGVGRSGRTNDSFTHDISWGSRRTAAPLPRELLRSAIDPRYQYASADLREKEPIASLVAEFRPHRILHLASGLRDDSWRKLFRCNIEGTANLLEAVGGSRSRVERVVVGSSGGVYGLVGSTFLPISELHACNPLDLYGISKLAAEQVARVLGARYETPVVFARIFNVVGPGQDERHVCGRFMAQASAIRAGLRPPSISVGNLESTRDFIDARDVAVCLAVLSSDGRAGDAYNVASGHETTIREILLHILTEAGVRDDVTVSEEAPRTVDVSRHVADTGRLRQLGFAPRVSLPHSLRDLFKYYSQCVATRAQAASPSARECTRQGPGLGTTR